MRYLLTTLILSSLLFAQTPVPIPAADATRIAEFYRLAPQIDDKIWAGWSKTPASLLLVTQEAEYLTHFPDPPKGFVKTGDDFQARPRQFSVNLQATFPAFGFPPVIVIGEPANTASKTSTPWLIVVMHEHFHQLQWAQPGYMNAINGIGLSKGDTTGMWMLNYPFPYEEPEIATSFAHLRDTLLAALAEVDQSKFAPLAKAYLKERKAFFAQFLPDDRKYLSFQLWQEGVARYTQIKAAEAAADYQPTEAFAALPDYTPFSTYALTARARTLDELKHTDIAQSKRETLYSFGAAECLLLDRVSPDWKTQYFQHLLTTEPLFPPVR
jgi:hypothetical protein